MGNVKKITMAEVATAIFSHQLEPIRNQQLASRSDFVAGMRRFPAAVNLITTQLDGKRLGLTASAVCSLSADPPRLIACVNTSGSTFAAIRSSGAFAVNSLTVEQQGLGAKFAASLEKGEDRFENGTWFESEELGMPILDGANCSFECALSEMIDGGTHAVLVGNVVHVANNHSGAPLLYSHGNFCGLLRL